VNHNLATGVIIFIGVCAVLQTGLVIQAGRRAHALHRAGSKSAHTEIAVTVMGLICALFLLAAAIIIYLEGQ
jgi:hypothetical protein